jgi:hypothetical protein
MENPPQIWMFAGCNSSIAQISGSEREQTVPSYSFLNEKSPIRVRIGLAGVVML